MSETPQQIIDTLLPTINCGFRPAIAEYKCVEQATSVISRRVQEDYWPVEGELTVCGPLGELAFELRDEVLQSQGHTTNPRGEGQVAWAASLRKVAGRFAIYEARPEHWVIAAIAALEGESE